jgi:hypothetical protein
MFRSIRTTLRPLRYKFRRRADAADGSADNQHIALQRFAQRRTVFELLDQQRGEPPVLMYQGHESASGRALDLSSSRSRRDDNSTETRGSGY